MRKSETGFLTGAQCLGFVLIGLQIFNLQAVIHSSHFDFLPKFVYVCVYVFIYLMACIKIQMYSFYVLLYVLLFHLFLVKDQDEIQIVSMSTHEIQIAWVWACFFPKGSNSKEVAEGRLGEDLLLSFFPVWPVQPRNQVSGCMSLHGGKILPLLFSSSISWTSEAGQGRGWHFSTFVLRLQFALHLSSRKIHSFYSVNFLPVLGAARDSSLISSVELKRNFFFIKKSWASYKKCWVNFYVQCLSVVQAEGQ